MSDVATDASCPFCRIVAGQGSAEILFETETVLAFRDLNPRAPVHVLLIPKEHLRDVRELEERHGGMLADLFQGAHQVARAEGIDEGGFRLVANTGRDGGQHVFHLHVHLLGGRPMDWPPG